VIPPCSPGSADLNRHVPSASACGVADPFSMTGWEDGTSSCINAVGNQEEYAFPSDAKDGSCRWIGSSFSHSSTDCCRQGGEEFDDAGSISALADRQARVRRSKLVLLVDRTSMSNLHLPLRSL